MENKEATLSQELAAWKQKRLEEGKFPCMCGHLESLHAQRVCITCHEKERTDILTPDYNADFSTCSHPYKQMDNLSLIEWMAQNKLEKDF